MISRRNFVTGSTLALGSALIANASSGLLIEQKKLGIALVGLGNYAKNQLAPALQLTKYCELRGIVTGTPSKTAIWSAQYNIPKKNIYNYENFDSIANNPDIDIVYVVLPNFMHAEYTIRAAKAGKHVICEKPMALNATECENMIAACKKANVHLSIGYRLYFEPHHLKMRLLGVEKTLGAVKMMESSLGFSMANPNSWRLNASMGGGGAIMDLGVYCIQGARRTVGELPISVTAQGFNNQPDIFKDIYEGMTFQMVFPSGARSSSTTTYTSYVDRLYATTGYQWFELSPAYNATGATGKYFDEEIKEMEITDAPYQQIGQMDNFAMCINENKISEASGEEGLIDLKIIEAIKKAAQTGMMQHLSW